VLVRPAPAPRIVRGAAVVGLVGLVAPAGCKGDDACSALDPPAAASAAAEAPCAKTEDCPRSCLCRDLGRCAKGEAGACVVGADAHCRASRVCKLVGHCTARDGECVAGSDADCRASSMCEAGGKCAARDGRCVAAPSSDARPR
jgi:hypothetical protein